MSSGRSVRPILYFFALIILIFSTISWHAATPSGTADNMDRLLARSHRVLAYGINAHRSAVFRIQPQSRQIEIITNLDVTAESTTPEQTFDYAIRVLIRDPAGNLLRDEVYWERTKRSEWLDEKTGSRMVSAFYLNSKLAPCDSRISTIFFPEQNDRELFLTIQLLEPANGSVSVRAYHHLDIIRDNELSAVKPISRRLREKMSRHNLYGKKVSETEMRRFLRDVWRQLPAEGLSGTSYVTRDLFLYNHEIPVAGEKPQEGFPLAEKRPVILPVEGPARLSISFTKGATVRAVFHSDTHPVQRRQFTTTDKKSIEWAFDPGAHFIELTGSGAIRRIETSPETAWRLPQPPENLKHLKRTTLYYRAMPPGHGIPLEIDLPGSPDGIDYFKMLCRLPLADSPDMQPAPYTLNYSFLNADGEIVSSGKFSSRVIPSAYAEFATPFQQEPVFPSRADHVYIIPPDTARTLQLTASVPVDIALFSRLMNPALHPIGPRMNRVDNLFSFPETTTRNWFYFRPLNASDLRDNGQSDPVRIPWCVHEPDTATETRGAARQAETIFASGNHGKTSILEQFQDTEASRDPTGQYMQIQPSKPLHIRTSGTGDLQFRFNLDPSRRPDLTVRIDGNITRKFKPMRHSGGFLIPNVPPGPHRIRIESQSLRDRFYLKLQSWIQGAGVKYKQRTVYQLNPGSSISVDIYKNTADTGLNIIPYALAPENTGLLSVSLPAPRTRSAGQLFHAVTRTEKQFLPAVIDSEDIPLTMETAEKPTPVILSGGTKLHRMTRVFFPLHDDIPPGQYRIQITSHADKPVYLRFFTMKAS